jgi:hypothetical protein
MVTISNDFILFDFTTLKMRKIFKSHMLLFNYFQMMNPELIRQNLCTFAKLWTALESRTEKQT